MIQVTFTRTYFVSKQECLNSLNQDDIVEIEESDILNEAEEIARAMFKIDLYESSSGVDDFSSIVEIKNK